MSDSQAGAVDELRQLLPPASTIYLVARAETRRHHKIVAALIVTASGTLRPISRLVAVALGRRYDQEREGIKIYENENAAMMVESLSRTLHGGGSQIAAEWV